MAFINYQDKDDMQEDIYSILSELFIDAIRAYRDTQVEIMFRDIDSIYILTHSRLDGKLSNDFEKRLEKLRESLYKVPEEDEERNLILSMVFDDLRDVLKELARALDETGILFKMRANLDELVTRK